MKLKELFNRKKEAKAQEPPPSWDAMKFAIKEDRPDQEYAWYAVQPEEMYTETIQRIKYILKSNDMPQELYDPRSVNPNGVAISYLQQARAVPTEAWDYALVDRADYSVAMNPQIVTDRAAALNIARLWYTQALQMRIGGGPMGLHILIDRRFKL